MSTRAVLLLILSGSLHASTILNVGDSVSLEFGIQFQPEVWDSHTAPVSSVRISANTDREYDYAATAISVTVESLDGALSVDGGIHPLTRKHYYTSYFGDVLFDYYAGKMTAMVSGPELGNILAGYWYRVRLTNVGGVAIEFANPNGLTFGAVNFKADGYSQGSGEPRSVLVEQSMMAADAIQSEVPEPSAATLAVLGMLSIAIARRTYRWAGRRRTVPGNCTSSQE